MPNDEISTDDQTFDQKVALWKAQFDHCVSINEAENRRREILENRSRFYLSFITLFLGAVTLNFEFLEKLHGYMIGNSVSVILNTGIYGCIIILAISLLVSLISILASGQIKPFKGVYSELPLPSPSAFATPDYNLIDWYRATSLNYTITLDHNKEIIDRKAFWLKVAGSGLYVAVISLFTLLALFTYLLFL